jgi:hypothetical protein
MALQLPVRSLKEASIEPGSRHVEKHSVPALAQIANREAVGAETRVGRPN